MRTRWAVALAFTLAVPPLAYAQSPPAGEPLDLMRAIALALAMEPGLRAARADVAVTQGLRLQAGLRSDPMLSVERRLEPGTTDNATTVGVEWRLDGFRRSPRIAIADAELRVAELEETELRWQRSGDVAAAYGSVAAAVRQLAITDEVLTAAVAQRDLLRARADQGSIPNLDRDVVVVEVRRMEAERVAQAGRADRALVRLKRLLGLSSDAALSAMQSLEELMAADLTGLGVIGAADTRPDVQTAEARVRAAEQQIDEARSEARPEVTVFGSYMRMDSAFPQRGFNDRGRLEPVRGQFNYLAAGATVSLPLWNRQQGSIAAATAAREAAAARVEATRLTAAAEVAEARLRYDRAREAVTLYQDGIRPLARGNLEIVRETYQLGRATVFDVLSEQRRYLEAERAYIDALSEAFDARIDLGRATGGVR